MTISHARRDSTVLVTGANRGLGQALVEEALDRGAKRVYACASAGMRPPCEPCRFRHDRRPVQAAFDKEK